MLKYCFELLMRVLLGIFNFFPVLPKYSDIFAFRNDAEMHDYYDGYSAFYRHPVKKFSVKKLVIIILQGTLFFMVFFMLLIGSALFFAQ